MSAPPPPPPAGEAASAGAAAAPDASWDLYALLSVDGQPPLSSSSSDKAIRSAYKKRAVQLHPDKNPDPQAAVLFNQVKLVYTFLSEPANRAAYDARLAARDARAAKDAALDSALATMKRTLLAREAEAAAASIAKRNLAREAALNPRGARSAVEIAREANEQLIRSMQQQGLFDAQAKPADSTARTAAKYSAASSSSSSFASSDERASKSQRTSTTHSGVHAGSLSHSGSGSDQRAEGVAAFVLSSSGDERSRTLVVRWAKPGAAASSAAASPSAESFHALLAAASPPLTLQHVFLLPLSQEKRKALLVFLQRSEAELGLRRIAAAQPGWDVKFMDDAAGADRATAGATSMFAAAPSAAAASAAAASAVAPATAADAAAAAVPSATLSPADYEQATLMRMAAIAKQNKLKRQLQQQQQATAATPAT